jgi:hypothetical protein
MLNLNFLDCRGIAIPEMSFRQETSRRMRDQAASLRQQQQVWFSALMFQIIICFQRFDISYICFSPQLSELQFRRNLAPIHPERDYLGGGQFGSVFRVRLRSELEQSDAKVWALKLLRAGQPFEELSAELVAMRALRHPNVLAFICLNFDDRTADVHQQEHGLVLPYMGGGSLEEHVRAHPERVSRFSLFLSAALDMARGLAYLHEQNPPIIHRDVALRNFLISSSGSLVISDFGLARLSQSLSLDSVRYSLSVYLSHFQIVSR